MAETNRRTIEVQLHLIADADIKKLEEIFGEFSRSMRDAGGGRTGSRTKRVLETQNTKTGGPNSQSGGKWPSVGTSTPTGRQAYPHEGEGAFHGIVNKISGVKSAIGQSWIGKTAGFIDKNWAAIYAGNIALQKAMGAQRAISGGLYGGGATALGASFGQSQSGIGGTPIGSPAFMTGFENKISALNPHNFFNPYYGPSRDIANAYGWDATNGPGKKVTNLLSSMLRSQMDPETSAKWVESLRYGGTNIAGLTGQVKSLGDEARAAHVTVKDFTASVQNAAEELAKTTGVSTPVAAGQVAAIAGAAGVHPNVVGAIMNDKTLLGIGQAMAGGDLAKLYEGRNAGLYQLRGLEHMVVPQLGYRNYTDLAGALNRNNPHEMHILKKNLYRMYQAGVLPVSPQEFITMVKHFGGDKKMTNAVHAWNDIQGLRGTDHPTMFRLRPIGAEIIASGQLAADTVHNVLGDNSLTTEKKLAKLQKLMGDRMHKKQEDTMTQKVQIGLTRPARRLITLIDNNDTGSAGPAITPSRGGGGGPPVR